MRATPLPLLTELAPGHPITRCNICGELVFVVEECVGDREARRCPSRAEIDEPQPVPRLTHRNFRA